MSWGRFLEVARRRFAIRTTEFSPAMLPAPGSRIGSRRPPVYGHGGPARHAPTSWGTVAAHELPDNDRNAKVSTAFGQSSRRLPGWHFRKTMSDPLICLRIRRRGTRRHARS
jgi:hypothetical protein